MELAFPRIAKENAWFKEVAIVLGASILIALSAPFALHLPFTPVPIVLQSHVILLMGALLGSKRGALAVLAFLAQAAAGLPVLASGKCGILVFAGPTGGYLLGYVIGAYLVGLLLEKFRSRSSAKTFGALAAGSIAIYFFGALHLAGFVGYEKALLLGVVPFLLGDLVKTIVCARLLKAPSSLDQLA